MTSTCVAVGMTPFGKYPEQGIKDLTAWAVERLMADSPLALDADRGRLDVERRMGHGHRPALHPGPGGPHRRSGFEGIPIMNVENACAGGSSAFHGAYLGVAVGRLRRGPGRRRREAVATRDRQRGGQGEELPGLHRGHRRRGHHRPHRGSIQADAARKRARRRATGARIPRRGGGGDRSPFMDFYSMAARAHMADYGTTAEQLAAIAAKNHVHGSLNPDAQYRFAMTPEEVLADRVVVATAHPGHVRTRWATARRRPSSCRESAWPRLEGARPVRVRAATLGSGSLTAATWPPVAAERAYEAAGLGPEDIDVAEVHDATAFGELAQTEHLGFCPVGEGGPYAASGATALGGARPVNPSGGLECRGHPIGATGLAQITEIVTQLRGRGRRASGRGSPDRA